MRLAVSKVSPMDLSANRANRYSAGSLSLFFAVLRPNGAPPDIYALKMQRIKLYISGMTVLLSWPPRGTEI